MSSHKSLPGCFSGLFTRSRPPKQPKNLNKEEEVKKDKEGIQWYSPCCDFSYGKNPEWCTISTPDFLPLYSVVEGSSSSQTVAQTIEDALDSLNVQLRELSLKIHGHPEIMFEERYAHDLLTDFMANQGFQVSRHYLGLETAWRAEFTYGSGGRVVGINSEMDALPGIGHACGHNLIAASGVGIAIALKAAMETHRTPGKVVLLGTPAEEAGGGKALLLEKGGYKEMDACIMCHPSPGPPLSASIGTTIAMQPLEVEYFGHSAHAGAAPWEGTNALDAAFLAYSSISALRQQLRPDCRIHGIIQGNNWSPNVIPDYSKMRWLVRAPSFSELEGLTERVRNCLQAGALATGCNVKFKFDIPYYDLRQNTILGQYFADIVGSKYNMLTTTQGSTASTDFGNVSYALPSLHPNFAIPTEANGGNHTPAFEKSAATQEAHDSMMVVSKGLALTGYRILNDSQFMAQVKNEFDRTRAAVPAAFKHHERN